MTHTIRNTLAAATLFAGMGSAPAMAFDDDTLDAALGGGIGGALGSAIGNELGGRTGALIGGAAGAAGGTMITHDGDDGYDDRGWRGRDYDHDRRGYRGHRGYGHRHDD